MVEKFWLDGVEKTNNIAWTYDSLGRLVDEVFQHYDPTLTRDTQWLYDITGNRLEQAVDRGNNGSIDEKTTYGYDANDRLLTELLDLGSDGTTDRTTAYTFTGTQQTGKQVRDSLNTPLSTLNFSYDLQGRLAQAVSETFDGSGTVSHRETTTYDYDHTGIRVSALHEVDADTDGTLDTRTLTEYVVDPQNFTGYQQVLQETLKNADTGEIQKRVVYTVGHDVIGQSTTEYTNGVAANPVTLTLGYDGHGSTRALTDLAAAIATIAGVRQVFAYDAYGNAIGFDPAFAATSLLYSGEQFDGRIQQQYLRARYYDPATGRFTRLDPFVGNLNDPQSLHKYQYTHADPVNGIDPTGDRRQLFFPFSDN